jgi:hypothetical protein
VELAREMPADVDFPGDIKGQGLISD